QRQPHPAFELDGGCGRGEVAETHIARVGSDELAAVAQPLRAVTRAHADELEPLRARERRTLRERPADEVALFLEQALEPEIIRRGVAVELSGRDVPFLDAQRVERVEAVRAHLEPRARLEQRSPSGERLGGWNRDFIGQLTGERDPE